MLKWPTDIWLSEEEVDEHLTDARIRDWLLDKNSLSNKLRSFSEHTIDFFLESEQHRLLPKTERGLLSHSSDHAYIRTIQWIFQKKLWVLARTVIPPGAFQALRLHDAERRQRPIGEWLFSGTELTRHIDIARLTREHLYGEWIHRHYPTLTQKPKGLWARRSLFHYSDQPLLVIEVFLPDLLP